MRQTSNHSRRPHDIFHWWRTKEGCSRNPNSHWPWIILSPLSIFRSCGWSKYLKSSYATGNTLSTLSLHNTPGRILLSWRWRHYVLPKRRNIYPLRCAETQTKTVLWWTRAVKTWKLTSSMLFCTCHVITVKYSVIKKDRLNFVLLYFLNYTWYMNNLHNIWKRKS